MTREIRDNRDEEAVEEAPEEKPKLTLIVILSIAIGALLTILIGGSIYHWQSGKSQASELTTTKDELKRRTLQLTELQEQIAELSKQVHALKEFAVAKARSVAAATSEPPPVAPASNPPRHAEPETEKPAPASASNNQPVTKKTKPAEQDCQLVGKSPDEQAATLQRCMQSLDGQNSRR